MSTEDLLHKIVEKEAVIGIIGLGYTGLSLAHDFGNEGFKIVGYDIDATKIETLKKRETYLPFMPHGQLFSLLDEKRFKPTSDPNDLSVADVIIISVPTPLNAKRQPDISYILKACHTLAAAIKRQPAYATQGSGHFTAESGLTRISHTFSDSSHTLHDDLAVQMGEAVLLEHCPHPSEQQSQSAERRSVQKKCEKSRLKPRLIVLQSTTYPGTTEEEVLPLLERETDFKIGNEIFLAHVPEREDAGNPHAVLNQIPRICGGVTRKCMLLAKTLYEHITVRVYPCSSARIAEATKIYENTFRLINIAFVDEMKMVFDQMGINLWEVIQAASTKPFGFTAFYPGPGIGGECIPVDPLYLAWRAKKMGIATTMIDTASIINTKTSEYVVEKIAKALTKKLQGAKILMLGVAFKRDVGDIRESPALRIMEILKQKGAEVCYHDYFVPKLAVFNQESISLNEKILKEVDCTVIITDHSRYDWLWICQNSQLIVDTRNATKDVDRHLRKKVVL
jgi:UDP-N-acetyl-D-glucosamine dehydrogenase